MKGIGTFLAMDSGTTNTRVWLIREGKVLAKTQVQAGVRDTARTGSLAFLKEGIRTAIGRVLEQAGENPPPFALAAGMITSGLGLLELPHLQAPVGWRELAEAVESASFPDLYDLTIYFVRGVRSGPLPYTLEEAPGVDIIRGEETEVFGALETLPLKGPLLYLHLGSHSKVIQVDAEERIVGGITTLAGELIHAVQTQTILGSALPKGPVEALDESLLFRGAMWEERYGLSRTFFLIRILEQSHRYREAQLMSVFAGAVASADLHAMRAHGLLKDRSQQVILSGQPAFQPAWRFFLEREGFTVTALPPEETERAFLTGLQKIVFGSPAFHPIIRGPDGAAVQGSA